MPETAAPTLSSSTCEKCASNLITERTAAPWCAHCEWQLDTFDAKRRPRELTWKWQDRVAFRMAYRLNAAQFTSLVGRPVHRPKWDLARATLAAISVVMLALIAALLWAGVDLLWHPTFGPQILIGIVLVLFAIELRPRLGRLPKRATPVNRKDAPELHRLIDDVSAALGARPPHIVLLTSDFNASAGAIGWRRRRVLRIGLPLWAALTPQQRVAILGHELGHFVNGDARRGPLTSLAFTTFARLAHLTVPARARFQGGSPSAALAGLLYPVFYVIFVCLNVVIAWINVGITCIGLRSTQRAEYYADAVGARLAGTTAMVETLDSLVVADSIARMVQRAARRSADPDRWLAAANETRDELRPRLPRLRQLSIRESASLFASHPPNGMRARMLESRPYEVGSLVLSSATAARIDNEIAGAYVEVSRMFAGR
jgi:Zn-dependent protease with chaperone function